MTERDSVLPAPSSAELRARLIDLFRGQLEGPAGGPEEEIAESHVRDRYLCGVLAPADTHVEPEEQDADGVGDDDDETGAPAGAPAALPTLVPSSFGLTFCVAPDVDALRVTARWGRYERRGADPEDDSPDRPPPTWKRRQVEGHVDLRFDEGAIAPHRPVAEYPDVHVRGIARRHDGQIVISLFLINGQVEEKGRPDEAWMFQAGLAVESPDGRPIFRMRPHPRATDEEQEALALAYRKHVEFAVGHGVGVHVDPLPEDPLVATRVRTVALPVTEVPAQDARTLADDPLLEGLEIDMKALGETSPDRLPALLEPLPRAYAAWIERQRKRLTSPSPDLAGHVEAARETLGKCDEALARLREGIALLGRDRVAAECFAFANRAMHLQRVRSLFAERRRRHESASLEQVDVPANRSWRPFQLAFILLNLPSVTDLHHPHRSDGAEAVADLLWFPTGGGKTEAYLGLSAYVLALRRLQGEIGGRSGEHGVAVLMRYTLRLLTIQQFQRAAALACACEHLRRGLIASGDARWGSEPFRIGLWVGKRTTPNTTADAAEALADRRGSTDRKPVSGLGQPDQMASCPWCGSAIDPQKHLRAEKGASGRGRTFMFCGDLLGRCEFSEAQAPHEGLPLITVDEEIYHRLPSILIATVDKFARLPWDGRTQSLFGIVNGRCPRHGFTTSATMEDDEHPRKHAASGALPPAEWTPHGPLRPPDLVIQDELHLISGPLGTLAGLYETAIDELCSWEVDGRRVRPKVVASTATIRRAKQQVASLFLRAVSVFPPQGLDAEDNFFSVQRPDRPGRLYVGACAPGRRLKGVLIGVYVALLASAQRLYESQGRDVDPWMTLVGYFNTVRELAGMRRLVEDDVTTRLARIARRGLSPRRLPSVDELTSRRSATDIPEILDRLGIGFDPLEDDRREKARAEGRSKGRRPYDVLLATNMISVGVDVKRLGLIVVGGQPKTTSEYIQATSRVGRDRPGIVVTVYNWARPRDLSHYESFEHYHATFYEHVEPLSVTPFAERAVDRGLAALLVALVRDGGSELNANLGAGAIERGHRRVVAAIQAIVSRAEMVAESKATGEAVRRALDSLVDAWLKEASRGSGASRLGYTDRLDGQTRGLLEPLTASRHRAFRCPTSLRDVESPVPLLLDDRELGDASAVPPGNGSRA